MADTPDVETMKQVDGEQMQLDFELCDEFRFPLGVHFGKLHAANQLAKLEASMN